MRLRSIGIIATVWALAMVAHAGQQASIIKEIVVHGNQRVSKQAILANMRTKVGQPFLQENLDHDKDTLLDLGFFQSVDVHGTPQDNGNWQVNVDVVEFPVIKEIRITGNTVVKTEDILKVLTLKPGDVFNLRQSEPSARAVEALYSKKSYFARVTEIGPLSQTSGTLNPLSQAASTLNIVIVETRVGTVSVQGNHRTKEAVMRRLIKTRPGDVLSGAKVTADLKRLYNSQWFENPTPIDEPADLGVENLTYVVKEARTGQFSFGVQVDPASSVAGVLRLSDTNLSGTGQGLSLDLTQATQGGGPSVGLDYTNPFYDSKDTTIRASIYSRIVYRFSGVFGQTTSSSTSEYYERRTGSSVGFSRPINDTSSYGLGLRVENVNTQVNSTVSNFIQQDGDVAVATLGYTLNRRDVDTDPSRGDYLHISVEPGYSKITEIGGVGASASILGANLFLRDTIDYRHYWTNGPARTAKEIDAPRKVLALRLRAGDIRGKVPFFEQFFAGGVDTIRGYPEDMLWGREELLANLEYRLPVQKSFEFIPFVDYGGAWGGYGSINSYVQTQNPLFYLGFGAGVSFKIPGLGNIRLDLGLDEQFRSRIHFPDWSAILKEKIMSMKLEKMGWYVAVTMAGVMFGMGFKAPGDKVGTVDIGKVFSESDYSKKQQETLRAARAVRVGVLDLIRTYPVMRPDDATKFHDLSMKDKAGPDDKAEEDKITQGAKDADALYRALATKSNPTPAELAQIEDFNRRKDGIGVLQQKWGQEFQDSLAALADKLRADALLKVRDIIGQVARDQGFSVVFSTEVAPYSANDLTDPAIKLINKSKS